MTWVLRLFGRIPLLTLGVEYDEEFEEFEDEIPPMGGGSAHNFTLADQVFNPPEIDGEPWVEDKRRFGFGRL